MNEFEFKYHKRFNSEKHKFSNKYNSFESDFEIFQTALQVDITYNNYIVPTGTDKYSKIQGLDKKVPLPAFVAKKFRCADMNKGSNSGFRFTFLYDKPERIIYFVEIYFKGQNEIENKDRINKLF